MLAPEQRPVPQPGAGEIRARLPPPREPPQSATQRMDLYFLFRRPAHLIFRVSRLREKSLRWAPTLKRWKIGDRIMALVQVEDMPNIALRTKVTRCRFRPVVIQAAGQSRKPSSLSGTAHLSARGQEKTGGNFAVWRLVRYRHDGEIQLAKAFGARVITTAGSPEKCDACRKPGADVADDSHRGLRCSHELRRTTEAAEVILDMVGGTLHRAQLRSGGGGGAHCADRFSGQSEGDGGFPPHHAQAASSHRFDAARPFDSRQSRALRARWKKNVWPLIVAGKVKPAIYKTFPLKTRPQPMRSWKPAHTSAKLC